MKGYGLTLKPVWIQIIKEGNVLNNNNIEKQKKDGPMNYGNSGSEYTRKKKNNTIII